MEAKELIKELRGTEDQPIKERVANHEEYEKERLRKIKADNETENVYDLAKQFWLSPQGKDATKRAKDNNFK
jgi:hypothetical protein